MIRLLHVSDLHFGKSHAFRMTGFQPGAFSMAESIVASLGAGGGESPVDAIVVSGDLLDLDQSKDREWAKSGVLELAERLGVGIDKVVLVPGNHDITWEPDILATYGKFHYYDALLESLGLKRYRRAELPAVAVVEGDGGDHPLALLLLSSCELESRETEGIGQVTQNQLQTLKDTLRARRISASTHTLVAVLHHHLLPIQPEVEVLDPNHPERAPQALSVTADAPLVLRTLAEMGVVAVLHGHQHLPHRIRHAVLEPGAYSISIASAGSAGATGDGGRHFFVHEIRGGWIDSISYTQSITNPKLFTRKMPNPNGMDVCALDVEVRSKFVQIGESAQGAGNDEDESDLNYAFLSVVDCKKARRVFRETLQGEFAAKCKLQYLKLEGMYDLLGKWDLAIRFRGEPVTKHIKAGLLKPLRDQRMFGVGADFRGEQWVDVLKEWTLDDWLLGQRDLARGIRRRVPLENGDAYDAARCQKGLVFVRNEQSDGRLEDQLRGVVKDAPELHQIIESVAIATDAVVFEVFMSCSQTALINRLNRIIEPVLSGFEAQKYTLLCYGYDEREVSLGVAEALASK